MKKTPGYKLVTPSERRRLRRELRQMWSTVPQHGLDRARELAGVQGGKEHEFRIAAVKEQEGTQFIDYRVGINLRVGLVDDVVRGQKAKLLKVQLQCGERAWQITDAIYANRFQSTEQLNNWSAAIRNHVRLHLLERLRDTCIYVWDEAIAKASNAHGVRRIDLTALAEAHRKEIRKDQSRVLSIKRGAKKGSKQSKLQLTRRQFQVELAQYIRQMGEDVTRKVAVTKFHFPNLKAFDRAFKLASARWGQGRTWREYKTWVLTKIK